MAAPVNTPEDFLASPEDFDDIVDPDWDGCYDEVDELNIAAMRIQAARRGKAARDVVREKRSGDRMASAQRLTVELARAHAKGLAPTPDGLGWSSTFLDAVGLRVSSSLSEGLAALPHLTSVDLSDNRLLTLEGLEALPRLSSLVCKGNRLQGVLDYPAPEGGSRLRYADLRHNAISGAISLPPDSLGRAIGVDAHVHLETLLLDGNKLRSLRGIDAACHLTRFTATGNQLQDTAGTGALVRVTDLDLSENGLSTCDELSGMVALRTVRLNCNRLIGLPDLSALTALTHLDLHKNEIPNLEDLTQAIGGAKSRRLQVSPIRTLIVTENPLRAGRDDIRLELLHQLPNLETLDGEAARPDERVFAHNLHGADSHLLADIRRPYFSDHLNTAEYHELPQLLAGYRHQYTKAFQEKRVANESTAKGAGFWR